MYYIYLFIILLLIDMENGLSSNQELQITKITAVTKQTHILLETKNYSLLLFSLCRGGLLWCLSLTRLVSFSAFGLVVLFLFLDFSE